MSIPGLSALCLSSVSMALTVAPAAADPCRETIAAMFQGGPMDPFVRPKRHETTIRHNPDGSETMVTDVFWETVLKSVSASGGNYYLTYDLDMWSGPSFDGPWTPTGSKLPADFAEMTRQMSVQQAANLSETSCAGEVSVDGQALVKYVYRTKTDTNVHGSWFGGLYSAYLDPASGQLARLETAETVASWAPDAAAFVDITTVIYDPTISVVRPQ